MKILGTQLTATQYEAFRQALATQLPNLRVQTVNTAGKFAVSGRLTTGELAQIHTLYDAQRETVTASGFNMLAYQAAGRNRQQTHKARAMRTARAFRFVR